MKKYLIAIACGLLGGIWPAVLVWRLLTSFPSVVNFFFNYREVGPGVIVLRFLAAIFLSYLLSAYGIALVLWQLYIKRRQASQQASLKSLFTIEEVGFLAGLLLWYWVVSKFYYQPVLYWAVPCSLFWVLSQKRFVARNNSLASSLVPSLAPSRERRTRLRLIVPVVLISMLAAIGYSNFPGMLATAKTREQWAYTEFRDYKFVVRDIRNCQPLKAQIGDIKTVAPTWGRNVTTYEPGSSGHNGEFTLDVVGSDGNGIAHSKFHIFASVYAVQFTHDGKAEALTCP